MEINGYTRLAAVVARPIKHSLSPFIHNRAFELTGENGVYLAWDVAAEDLRQVLGNVRALDMYGLNISMPYKREVLNLVDYLTDEARLIGAVNTVANYEGKLVGHNTDGIGFFKSLEKFDFDVKNQEITVLGGGGAAFAMIAQAALLKAKKINVFARKSASFSILQERLTALSEQLKGADSVLSNLTEVEIALYDLSNLTEMQARVGRSSLLVNATPLGMEDASMAVDPSLRLPADILVVDAIYKVLETPFLKWAASQGAQTANGLGMLLYQAAESFKMWTGQEMPVAQIEKELADEIRS